MTYELQHTLVSKAPTSDFGATENAGQELNGPMRSSQRPHSFIHFYKGGRRKSSSQRNHRKHVGYGARPQWDSHTAAEKETD